MKVAINPTAGKTPLTDPENQAWPQQACASVLLEISTAIATVRERKELFAAILEKIKPVIPVDDTGLLVLDQTGRYWQDWTNVDNYQETQASAQLKQLGYDGFQPLDRWMTYTLHHSGIMTVAQFREQYPEHPFGAVMWEAGLREMMFTPLVNGGKELGVLFFDSDQEGTYTQAHLALFNAIAGLVAVAVANILANEEILEREREKSVLLSISEDIASVRDKVDLLRVVIEKIKPLFGFYDCGILVVDKDNYFHDLAAIHPDIDGSDVNRILNEQGLLQRSGMAFEGSALQEIMQRLEEVRQPVIFDYSADNSIYSEHQLLSLLHQKGYQEAMAGLLKTGGKAFGCFFINFVVKGQAPHTEITLFQNVADQLSVAVANILANEEILEREREKGILYNIAKCLATVKDKTDLLNFIFREMQPLFRFYDLGLLVLNEKENCYQDWSALYPQISPSQVNFQLHRENLHTYPLDDALTGYVFERLEKAGRPIIVDFNEFVERAFIYAALETEVEHGIREGLVAVLQVRGKRIGWLNLNSTSYNHFKEADFLLFGAIADQVAVAVANILANEEILEREREKSRLLEISQAIASVQEPKQLLKVIYDTIRLVFPFADAGLFVLDKEGYCRDLVVDEQVLDTTAVSTLTQQEISGRLYRHPVMEYFMAQGPVLRPLAEVYEQFPGHPHYPSLQAAGYQHILGGPLQQGGQTIGMLCFFPQAGTSYTTKDFTLFQAIADQVAVAVANIQANEEILQREQEKSRLLEISQAISQISQREDLLKVIIRHVQPLFGFDENALFVIDRDRKQYRMWYDNLVQPYEEGKRSQQGAGIPMEGNQVAADVFRDRPAYLRDREEMLAFSTGNASLTEWIVVSGTEEVLIGPLKVGGQIMGCFNSHSRRKGTFTTPMLPLYQNVCDQVAVAVANILANEEILEREREKSRLLEISQAIASVQNHKQLLKVIYQKIKPVFPYDNAGLFVFDQTGENYYEILHAEVLPDKVQAQLTEAGLLGPYPYRGHHPPAAWVYAGQPAIYSLVEQAELFAPGSAERATFEIGLSEGLRQMIGGPLYCGGKKIGLISFNARQDNFYTGQDLPLFQAVADQVAVAVANILANEEILQREREKSQLLEITKLIAQVKVKEDLLKLIVEKIRPLFGFHDCGLFVVGADGTTHSDLAALPGVDPSEFNQLHAPVSFGVPHRGSLIECMMQEIEEAGGPVLFDFKELVEQYPRYPQFALAPFLESGYRDCLAANLVVRGKAIGMFCINALQKDFFKSDVFSLFQSVAHSVAIAVANILANEEILEREREKSQLLEITELIAQVKATNDLLRLIVDKIKPLFGFHDCGLFVVSPDGKTHSDLAAVLPDVSPSAWNEAIAAVSADVAHAGSLVEWAMNELEAAGGPVLFDFKELVERFPDYPQFNGIGPLEMGYRDCLAASLTVRGKSIGFFCINALKKDFFSPAIFPLFRSVTHSISIAVANLLATEEILEREREKALLLSLSEDMATIRDRDDLLKVILTKIKPIIGFDDAVISTYSEDYLLYKHFVTLSPPQTKSHPLYDQIVGTPMPLKDNPDEYTFAQIQVQEVFRWDTDDILAAYPGHVIGHFLKDIKRNYNFYLKLSWGGRIIGFMHFHFHQLPPNVEAKYTLFKSIADQLSVAVANILANEEILAREREKSQLLEITELIAQVKATNDLLRLIVDKIKPLFGFHDCGLFVVSPDGKTHSDLAAVLPDVSPSEWNEAIAAVSADVAHGGSPVEWAMNELEAAGGPVLFDFKELVERFPDYPQLDGTGMLEMGYRDCLAASLTVRGKSIGFFCINALQKDFFSPAVFPLFQSVTHTIAIAVANIQANEEILEREREKSVLLSVSAAIAKVQNRSQLLKAVYQKVAPLLPHKDIGLFLVSEEEDQHWEIIDENVLEQEFNQIVWNKHGRGPFKHQGSGVDRLMNGPVILSIDDLMDCEHPYIPVMREIGLKEFLGGPLVINGKKRGMFSFNADRQGTYSLTAFPLFQGILDQLSVALANILANEEILQREREKSLQIAITQAMAEAGSWEEKFMKVGRELDQAVPFHHIYFSINAPAGHRGYGFVQRQKGAYAFMSHADFVQAAGLSREEFLRLQQESVGYYARPGYYTGASFTKICETYALERAVHRLFGHQSALNVPVQCENGMLIGISMGSLEAGAYQETHLALLGRLMPAITLALEKLLAYEDIQQREKEKTLQIAVNTTLSQAGTWQAKFLKVAQTLEEIIPWDVVSFNLDFINRGLTYVKRPDGTRFLSLEDITRDTGLSAGELYALRAGSMDHYHTDGIYTGESYAQSCRKYPFKQLVSRVYDLHSSLNVVAPLREGQHIVITFASHRPDGYRQQQLDFLRRIAPSLSLAVQKLLAYEEIEGREREKALQVAVINALTQEGSWEEKLLRLTRVLQTHIPLDYLFLVMEKDKQYGRGYGCLRIGFDEYQVFDTEGFFRMTGLTQQKYLALREQRPYAGPELLAGEAFEKASGKYALLGLLARTFHMQSNIALPLRLSHQGRFLLQVLAKKPQGLTAEHLALLEKITPSLAMTLENLLAYEQIKQLKDRLEVEKEYLEDEINVNYKFEDIIGASQSLKEVFKKVSQVAAADSTVLILGETGTGKELVARAIHNLSRRGDRALVKINCAALPAQLIESELFGHEKGAFTGAVDRRIGKFELAHGSTIFLDEVGELPLELQAKLLRAIQEKEVERLGGNRIIKTDVRIIAATNRNLEKEVAQGRFRSDLYFRLNVFPVTLPPLRNRKEDIPLLAVHFIRKMSKKLGKNITGISNAAIKEMQAYNWPGNIRELEHMIERAAITSSGIISELGLPEKDSDLVAFPVGGYVQQTLAQNERALVIETLKRCNGRIRGKGGAAELLDIEPNTLDARMKKLGIVKKQTFENGA